MAEIRTVTTLTAKRDEIEGVIAAYEKKLDQARADLSHINAVITLMGIEGEPLDYVPHTDIHRLFRYGEMLKLAVASLKDGPLTSGQVSMAIMKAKGFDTRDRVLLKRLSLRVTYALNGACQRRAVKVDGHEKVHGKRAVRIWALP